MSDTSIDLEEDIDLMVDEQLSPGYSLVVYNDNYNTFQHVIACFISYCKHSKAQAEQCSLIIHNNGKCDVKRGSFETLKPICEALLENGLTAKIEK